MTTDRYPDTTLHNPGWDPAGDGGPDCPYCGLEVTSGPDCTRDECPGEILTCNVTVFHGSRNPDSASFGPDEQCENDAEPGSEQCAQHQYVIDEPEFDPAYEYDE